MFTFVLLCLFIVYSKVRVEGDGIFVRAETSKLAQFRQTMDMGKGQSTEDPRTFLIVGGGMNSQSHLTNSCHGTQLPPATKHDLAVTSLPSRVQSSIQVYFKSALSRLTECTGCILFALRTICSGMCGNAETGEI